MTCVLDCREKDSLAHLDQNGSSWFKFVEICNTISLKAFMCHDILILVRVSRRSRWHIFLRIPVKRSSGTISSQTKWHYISYSPVPLRSMTREFLTSTAVSIRRCACPTKVLIVLVNWITVSIEYFWLSVTHKLRLKEQWQSCVGELLCL